MSKELALPKFNQPTNLDKAAFVINQLGKNVHEHAYLVGKALAWVKENIGHGNYGKWIEKNVWFSQDTAERYVKFTEKCDERGLIIEYSPRLQIPHRADFTKEVPPLPKGKYQVLYADPPWQYGQEQHGKEEQETVLESHYPTMPTEDICKLPIADLTGDNAVLFLWTTSPKLFEAKQVIDAWGFDYKSSMIWDKVKHNVGYYVSVRHEFLLICTKGSCLPDSNKLIDSVQTIERSNRHSEKPEKFYEIIEEMYHGKKIELFSRNKRQGWDCWGNETDKHGAK